MLSQLLGDVTANGSYVKWMDKKYNVLTRVEAIVFSNREESV